MSTKERILEAALRQFNELGTDQATLRSLAEELGISHGNLCYHFKNTDALIEALYDSLIAEIEPSVQQSQHPSNELEDMVGQAEVLFRLLYKYRFLMLDFVRIIRRIESVRQKFRTLIQLRRLQMRRGIEIMIRKGMMREEWIPGLYDRLITNMLVLGDNWIPNAEIHFDEKGEEVIRYYFEAFIMGLTPYLTDKGLEAFRNLK